MLETRVSQLHHLLHLRGKSLSAYLLEYLRALSSARLKYYKYYFSRSLLLYTTVSLEHLDHSNLPTFYSTARTDGKELNHEKNNSFPSWKSINTYLGT